jgi:2-polyprenyl-3-methyl-5-hydroxy-6-metoxy-1,4-benzoquinol methylase
MLDSLSILFGSTARVKLLRFFLFNPTSEFTFDDISRRAKLVRRTARTELNALERADVIKKKQVTVEVGERKRKVKVQAFVLNENFPQLESLQKFLFETAPIDGKTLVKHLRKAGTLDVVIAAGVFMRNFDARLDVLIGMKDLKESKVETAIRSLESELGIEIRYAAMNTEDLVYRVGMYDKLTRDVFDYPHQILVDRVEIRNELRRG